MKTFKQYLKEQEQILSVGDETQRRLNIEREAMGIPDENFMSDRRSQIQKQVEKERETAYPDLAADKTRDEAIRSGAKLAIKVTDTAQNYNPLGLLNKIPGFSTTPGGRTTPAGRILNDILSFPSRAVNAIWTDRTDSLMKNPTSDLGRTVDINKEHPNLGK